MKKKILFCATVDYHFKAFHLPTLEWFKQHNWEVHVAACGSMNLPFVDRKFDVGMKRSPFSLRNISAYKKLKTLIEEEDYEIIHCHTPMGGVLGRLAARNSRKRGSSVIYTAHGFHFYKGAPLMSWLLYYPIEKQLARITDCLITINREDYSLAHRHRFRAGHTAHIHGVGIDMDRYQPVSRRQREQLRESCGYSADSVLLFFAAEFNRNKNQELLIRAVAMVQHKLPQLRLLLAGEGAQLSACKTLAEKLGVSTKIDFLGYRDDIGHLLPMCDAAVSSSLREGLPVNIMEAMACGLPIIGVRNRGLAELVTDGRNGFLTENDAAALAGRMLELCASAGLRRRMGEESAAMVDDYSLEHVSAQLAELYSGFMRGRSAGEDGLQWATL